MRRIWYVFIVLLCLLNASWSLAAQETLFESVQELDGEPGTSKGSDWRLTDFANFALQNDNNDELFAAIDKIQIIPWGGDISFEEDQGTIYNGVFYICITSHLSASETEPGIGALWENAWEEIIADETDPVFIAWDKDYADLINTPTIPDASTFSGDFEPLKGADDNYVTDAEKTVLGNTSGINTGDQDLSGKQDTLVSGTNIKTVNSTSILGSGDIAVEGALPTGTEGQMIEYDTNGDPIAITPDEVTFAEPLSYDDTLKEVSIDTTGLGGSSVTFTDTDPTATSADGIYQLTVSPYTLWTKGTDWLCESGVGCDAIDTTPPVASNFATDSTGLQYSFTASETSTVDCTKLTATWANAGTVADFTGTDSPCVSSTPVYSDDTGTMAGAQGFLIDAATNESIAFSGLSIDNSLNETVASTIGSIVPDFSYDFEDGTTGDLTLNTPTGATITVSDVEPLSGVYSAQIDINEAVTIVPYMSKSFTGTTDYATNFKFALSSNFRSVNIGGVVTLSRFYNGAATVSGLQLKWNGANMVLVLDESIVITRGVEHMITHRITSTNMYVYLDGELVYTSPDTTHSIPNSIRVGLVLGHSFNTGISAKFDDWGMGSYVE
jgi:hypothetical protein